MTLEINFFLPLDTFCVFVGKLFFYTFSCVPTFSTQTADWVLNLIFFLRKKKINSRRFGQNRPELFCPNRPKSEFWTHIFLNGLKLSRINHLDFVLDGFLQFLNGLKQSRILDIFVVPRCDSRSPNFDACSKRV
jgi:hypothetical protein